MAAVKPKVYKKGGEQRFGKGFSREELKKVKLSSKEAMKLQIPVDYRRRTAHEENIKVIKTLLENKKAETKSKRKAKS